MSSVSRPESYLLKQLKPGYEGVISFYVPTTGGEIKNFSVADFAEMLAVPDDHPRLADIERVLCQTAERFRVVAVFGLLGLEVPALKEAGKDWWTDFGPEDRQSYCRRIHQGNLGLFQFPFGDFAKVVARRLRDIGVRDKAFRAGILADDPSSF